MVLPKFIKDIKNTFEKTVGSVANLEGHYVGYNFMGGGTDLRGRLTDIRADKSFPIDVLDDISIRHDLGYVSTNPLMRALADARFLDEVNKLPASPTIPTAVSYSGIEYMLIGHLSEFIASQPSKVNLFQVLKGANKYERLKELLKGEGLEEEIQKVNEMTEKYNQTRDKAGIAFDENGKTVIPDMDKAIATFKEDISPEIEKYTSEKISTIDIEEKMSAPKVEKVKHQITVSPYGKPIKIDVPVLEVPVTKKAVKKGALTLQSLTEGKLKFEAWGGIKGVDPEVITDGDFNDMIVELMNAKRGRKKEVEAFLNEFDTKILPKLKRNKELVKVDEWRRKSYKQRVAYIDYLHWVTSKEASDAGAKFKAMEINPLKVFDLDDVETLSVEDLADLAKKGVVLPKDPKTAKEEAEKAKIKAEEAEKAGTPAPADPAGGAGAGAGGAGGALPEVKVELPKADVSPAGITVGKDTVDSAFPTATTRLSGTTEIQTQHPDEQVAPELPSERGVKYHFRDRRPFFVQYGTDLITETKEKQEVDAVNFANFAWVPKDAYYENGINNKILQGNLVKERILSRHPYWLPSAEAPKRQLSEQDRHQLETSLAPIILHHGKMQPIITPRYNGKVRLNPLNPVGAGRSIRDIVENRWVFPSFASGMRV